MSTRVDARTRARKKVQEALAARRKREEENAAHLESFFADDERAQGIDADVEREIAAMRAKAEAKRAALEERKSASLRGLKDNGESVGTIAELTGISTREVRALLLRTGAEDNTDSVGS